MADIKKMLDDDGVQFYPETSANGCYLDDGTRLVDHCLAFDTLYTFDGTVPINADKLGGKLPSEYATKTDVDNLFSNVTFTPASGVTLVYLNAIRIKNYMFGYIWLSIPAEKLNINSVIGDFSVAPETYSRLNLTCAGDGTKEAFFYTSGTTLLVDNNYPVPTVSTYRGNFIVKLA